MQDDTSELTGVWWLYSDYNILVQKIIQLCGLQIPNINPDLFKTKKEGVSRFLWLQRLVDSLSWNVTLPFCLGPLRTTLNVPSYYPFIHLVQTEITSTLMSSRASIEFSFLVPAKVLWLNGLILYLTGLIRRKKFGCCRMSGFMSASSLRRLSHSWEEACKWKTNFMEIGLKILEPIHTRKWAKSLRELLLRFTIPFLETVDYQSRIKVVWHSGGHVIPFTLCDWKKMKYFEWA